MLRLDLHIHTTHSSDGFCSVADVIKAARRVGLKGVAFTDHDSIGGNTEAMEIAPGNFLIILGIEVSSLDGHILDLR